MTVTWNDYRHILLVNSVQRNLKIQVTSAQYCTHYDLQNQNYMYRASRPYFDCDVDVITFHETITSCVFGVEKLIQGVARGEPS